MGLDTYPSRTAGECLLTTEDEAALADLDLSLCGAGLHGSFRGKVYEDVVHRVTGGVRSLYELWMEPEQVAELAAAFAACDPDGVAHATKDDYYPVTADEVRALTRLFRLCADRGLGLYADI